MTKPELGTKRYCPECSTRFYDLTRNPAVCPKCEHSFDPDTLFRSKRNRPEPKLEVKPETAAEEGEATETEEEETEDVKEISDDQDLIATAEATDEDGNAVESDDDDELADIEVDDTDDDDTATDDTLMEMDDEDDDVTGIIDPAGGKESSDE